MNTKKHRKLPQGRELTPHNKKYKENAQSVYDELRIHAPRHHDNEYGRILLTTFSDVRAVVRDKRFSVDAQFSHEDSYMRRIAGTGLTEGGGKTTYAPPLVLLDDPDHRRVRGLMAKAFTPRVIENMRGRIKEITANLLNAIDSNNEIDLVADFAGPLPTRAVLDMMGMVDASVSDFKIWSEDILMGYDPERDKATRDRLRIAYGCMSREFKKAVDLRRKLPGDDLISAMVRAQEDEDRLSELEIISLCTQLMVAGNVTTSDLIANGLYALINHPQELEKLRNYPSLIENAVEEMLRFDCPITETARISRQDLEIGGCPVKSGQTITASLAAANHDPTKFLHPHDFDIERDSKDHLGFGSGIHVCLGAPLARLESQVAIAALLERFEKISLHPDIKPVRRKLPFFSGFTSMRVRLE